MWDEVAVQVPGALSQLPHAGETLAFEVALASPIAGLTPDSLWLMQSMIEAELGVLLAGAAVRMLAATTKAEHGLVLVAEASLTRELACAHAWARLARFVENGTVASLQVHAVVVASACRVEVRLRSTADTARPPARSHPRWEPGRVAPRLHAPARCRVRPAARALAIWPCRP